MKKQSILNLIRYYSDNNDIGFKKQAYAIADEFSKNGDVELAQYIMTLLSTTGVLVPQSTDEEIVLSSFFEKIKPSSDSLFFPDSLIQDLLGVVNAVKRNIGIHKFLFHGAPGTGKTQGVQHLAKLLRRETYTINFTNILDCKLGQTQKNIQTVFKEINCFPQPNKIVVLFDEIDALAMDRINANDLREMGRVTSTLLKNFDTLNEDIVLIATTNLFSNLDKALIRRFDSTIDFNSYTKEDLIEIAQRFLDFYLSKIKVSNKNIRVFRKILNLYSKIPYPGELKNVIKTAIAFSDPDDGYDYLRRLYYAVCNEKPDNIKKLQEQCFTVREIEILSTKSKSSVSRELRSMLANA
ncbi:ATP-dependent zinc metalloprotease FtsH [Anaerobiospirillum thomasii]|uniref:ATP-binding protein n=1 Tax=Anaerobiospirillum thomasii TaxID=179995 RepID=UPI000D8807D8|nr:ATP-binding protein [Anaerobiospirillum thomasii]SPT67745.1 ATP-dependent zinc metalloprotease FtsH [Anaerobiospirillum thomasii]